ncbi:hypothetical protein A262_01029 [Pseudomonas syringae pv. actinidiae ICMP 19073]|nr:hypothetical protein A262_01029 [Pseudomonas syringae pv. actinidiae ICMP 19073]
MLPRQSSVKGVFQPFGTGQLTDEGGLLLFEPGFELLNPTFVFRIVQADITLLEFVGQPGQVGTIDALECIEAACMIFS